MERAHRLLTVPAPPIISYYLIAQAETTTSLGLAGLLAFISFLAAPSAFAQSGLIQVIAVDPADAVIPNAKIAAWDEAKSILMRETVRSTAVGRDGQRHAARTGVVNFDTSLFNIQAGRGSRNLQFRLKTFNSLDRTE
jgi:hypothetical protein